MGDLRYVPGSGSPSAKLMIVGEAPGAEEEDQLDTMVGPTGRFIQGMLREAGIGWSEIWRTNVLKYRPPDNKIKRLPEIGLNINSTINQLWDEINQIQPNCILAFGNLALKALTGHDGIMKWRGSILTTYKGLPKVVPTIHPAGLLKPKGSEGALNYQVKYYVQLDVARAVEESRFPILNLPKRHLQICRNSGDLFRFFQEYKDKKRFTADIEVKKSVPTCVSMAFNSHHALSIPLLNVQNANNMQGTPMHDLVEIWKMLDNFWTRTPGLEIIGQNWKFDEPKLRMVGFLPPPLYADTALMAHTINPEFPASLQFLASIRTKEPYYKDDGREFDYAHDNLDKLLTYNARDSAVDYEVFESLLSELKEYHLEDFYFNFVNKLHDLYIGIEKEGLAVNQDKRAELLRKYLNLHELRYAEMVGLVGHEVNVMSPQQMAKLLYEELKCPQRANVKEETLVALLANAAKKPEQIRAIELTLEIRRIRKTISTYLLAVEDYDGRHRTNFRIGGTETGRTSTSVLKPPVRPTQVGMAFHTLTKHGEIGADIRHMFDADPGYIFQEFDQSQAEARVVALLAEDLDLLDAFDRIDMHRVTASWFFKQDILHLSLRDIRPEMVKNITPDMRFIGKTGRHGGHYDMGKHRLMEEINTNARKFNINVNVSEWKAGQILDIFHARSPKIRGVFHASIRRELEDKGVLISPYGRRREFFGRFDEELLREGYSQLPQATVSDHTKWAAIKAKKVKPTLRICLEGHDSLLVQSKENEVMEDREIIKELMEIPIDFSSCSIPRGILKIPCEVQMGANYKDLKKVA